MQDIKWNKVPFGLNKGAQHLLGLKESTQGLIILWLLAFSRFMTVALIAEPTSKDKVVGLATHHHRVILQPHNGVGHNQQLK